MDFSVLSHSSEEIIRGIDDFSIEAGITYLDNEPIEGLLPTVLYRERYCLFVPRSMSWPTQVRHLVRGGVTSRSACSPPICRTGG